MITPTTIADTIAELAGRRRWRKATNLAELANLQADRLARNLHKTTNDPHDRGWTMYSALVALGRAGVVVHDWRPGTHTHEPDGVTLETRACVTGFADTPTKDWLDNLLYFAGNQPGATRYELTHVFELYGPGCEEYDACDGDDSGRSLGRAWVERINGEPTVRIGSQMNAGQVYRAFPNFAVEEELRRAWQITICAPTWGDGRMFADLLRLLCENRRPAMA